MTKKNEVKPYCNHCNKEGHDERHCWKFHLELKAKRNGGKGRQKMISTMLHDHEYNSYHEVKVTTVGFVGVGPIDLGYDSGDEINML